MSSHYVYVGAFITVGPALDEHAGIPVKPTIVAECTVHGSDVSVVGSGSFCSICGVNKVHVSHPHILEFTLENIDDMELTNHPLYDTVHNVFDICNIGLAENEILTVTDHMCYMYDGATSNPESSEICVVEEPMLSPADAINHVKTKYARHLVMLSSYFTNVKVQYGVVMS